MRLVKAKRVLGSAMGGVGSGIVVWGESETAKRGGVVAAGARSSLGLFLGLNIGLCCRPMYDVSLDNPYFRPCGDAARREAGPAAWASVKRGRAAVVQRK